MKMRARTNDLIILTPDAYGYIEHEDANGKPKLKREDLGHRTVRVLKAYDKFSYDWPANIPSTNLMLVRCEGQEYMVSREHRHLCLVAGS